MYLIAIAWIYVVLMMALAEALSAQGTVLGAIFTFLLYGCLPLSVVMYLLGTPMRRRARLAAEAVARAAGCRLQDLTCWLGPCIGPRQFEVGPDVVEAFGGGPRFVARPRPDGQMRWLADLPGLARDRLAAAGVCTVVGGAWCTVEDASAFFSFRRDGVTGRQAAAVWLRA